ncbi:MAG: phage baseplate protein [Verrucomicrobiota bacterium]|nr:phage baseplate protein [Chthoniobacterales bacterium]MDQ3413747.1 phage baseplate protein [Verrucomicrobiota bacterium]
MQSLSAAKILALWEAGRTQHALDRALTILLAASPGASRGELADLSIGERDARLLQLRRQVLGAGAEGFAECPGCTERVEFPLDIAALEGRAPSRPPDTLPHYEIESSGDIIRFRLPTSHDLAEAVAAPDSSLALRELVERCAGQANLPNETVEAISQAMLQADPAAEITLQLSCPVCAQEWDLLFDISAFFWAEIAAQAQRLLREIDALARAYGWTEHEILSLPAQRRETYLELVAA